MFNQIEHEKQINSHYENSNPLFNINILTKIILNFVKNLKKKITCVNC
jgi:hypothetical protein